MLLYQHLDDTHRLLRFLLAAAEVERNSFVPELLNRRPRNQWLRYPHLDEALLDVAHKIGRGPIEGLMRQRTNNHLEMPRHHARRRVPYAHQRLHIRHIVLDRIRVVDVVGARKIHCFARVAVYHILRRAGLLARPTTP